MKNRYVLQFVLMAFLSAFGLSACNRTDRVEAARERDAVADRNAMSSDDEAFARYAAEVHNAQNALAEQAKQKSTNKDVLSYADAVIHLNSDALKSLSKNVGFESDTALWDTKRHLDFLGTMSGTQFDQLFLYVVISNDESAIPRFREEMNATHNEDLKNYLRDALPGLDKGLHDGQVLQRKIGRFTTN